MFTQTQFMKRLLALLLLCSLWACKKNDHDTSPPPPSKPDTVRAKITVWDGTQWNVDKPKGVPAVGAEVRLYSSVTYYKEGWVAYSAITDEHGVATFNNLPEGEYYMLAFKGVIHQGEISNTWDDGDGKTLLSDSIFQTQAEIDNPQTPRQPGAVPGDLRYKDINQDGLISDADMVATPYLKFSVTPKTDTAFSTIIANPVNHEMTLYKTEAQVDSALLPVVKTISTVYQRFRMLDGILSDDADCNGLPEWCEFDNFTFTADNAILANLWKDAYACILQLNRMKLSLDNFQSENKELRAQITAFRGLLFSDLMYYFGENVPITHKAKLPRTVTGDTRELRQAAYFQFSAAISDLPVEAPAGKKWRMTQDAAALIIARYTGAGSTWNILLKPILKRGKYSLVAPSQVFVSPDNSEIIWDMTFGMTPEFKQYFVRSGTTVNFFPVARYREALLLNVLNYSQFELDTISTLINTVRVNRQEAPITFTSFDDAQTELNRLLAVEFYREGFRFLRLGPQREAVLGSKGYQQHHHNLPIPSYILRDYPKVLQNEGY